MGKLEIRRASNKRLLKPICTTDYPSISLQTDTGGRDKHSMHRIIAKQYINNPDPVNLIEVNHKDGDKKNYNIFEKIM